MCTGYTYQLACGHTLTHVSARCRHHSSILSTTCLKVAGPSTPLNDTCAPCHPEYRIKMLREAYEKRLIKRMRDLIAARKAGLSCTARKLEDLDRGEREKLRRDIAEAERKGRGCTEDVLWPGKDVNEMLLEDDISADALGIHYRLRIS
jgi:hypothetical protein